jgi:pimeloyl-ACP methyl ester carboxylesterase
MGLVAGLYAADHPNLIDRLLLSGAISPLTRAPSELPPELVRERDEAIRRDGERVDAEALKRLEDSHAAGEWTDGAAYCREHRRLSGVRQFGRPGAMPSTRADPCALPNEWPTNVASLMHRVFSELQGPWNFREHPDRQCTDACRTRSRRHRAPERGAPVGNVRRERARHVDRRRRPLPWLEDPDAFFPAVDAFLRGDWPARAERVTHAY